MSICVDPNWVQPADTVCFFRSRSTRCILWRYSPQDRTCLLCTDCTVAQRPVPWKLYFAVNAFLCIIGKQVRIFLELGVNFKIKIVKQQLRIINFPSKFFNCKLNFREGKINIEREIKIPILHLFTADSRVKSWCIILEFQLYFYYFSSTFLDSLDKWFSSLNQKIRMEWYASFERTLYSRENYSLVI